MKDKTALLEKKTISFEDCVQIVKSMPTGQAIQYLKSEITGLPETQVIDGDLVVSLIDKSK